VNTSLLFAHTARRTTRMGLGWGVVESWPRRTWAL